METLDQFSPDVQIYSVDEAFLDITHIPADHRQRFGERIRETIYRWTGIPVSVGIATTKTLAKVAAEIAKKTSGVLDISSSDEEQMNELLRTLDVRDIWGVGYASTKMLNTYGISTAYNFKSLNEKWVRMKMGVNGVKTWNELNGISVSGSSHLQDIRRSAIHTRSFRGYVRSLPEMKAHISDFTTHATRRLRKEGLVAGTISVFLRTNYHNKNHKQYTGNTYVPFGKFSSYNPEIVKFALEGLERIYKDGYIYKRAGIVLSDIRVENDAQYSLFVPSMVNKDVMKAIDTLNDRWGEVVKMGVQQRDSHDYVRKYTSRNYTSSWSNLLTVK
jgi:DNA polymerase V